MLQRRRILEGMGEAGIVDSKNSTYADIVLANKDSEKKIIISGTFTSDELSSLYPPSLWEPIGVVVIPGSHDVYGTGQCGVMSLMSMDRDNPENGIYRAKHTLWHKTLKTVSVSSCNISKVSVLFSGAITKEESGASWPSISSWSQEFKEIMRQRLLNSEGTLISAGFSSIPTTDNRIYSSPKLILISPEDNISFYVSDSSSGGSDAAMWYTFNPSPYLEEGKRNPKYSSNGSDNGLSRFNGEQCTTDIINQYGQNAEAAWLCRQYRTIGTSSGDWYLPTLGESGYLISRMKEINSAITLIKTVYGSNKGGELFYTMTYGNTVGYWTSTIISNNPAVWNITTIIYSDDANVNDYYHGFDNDPYTYYYAVKAFMRL